MRFSNVALCAALALGVSATANAGVIIAPVSGVIDSGGPGYGPISETFDQSGLSVTYTPGVTDFDTYMAGNPQHSYVFSGNEWFSNQGATSAQVTYDFGSVVQIDAFALWHEDASGFTRFALSGDANPNFLFGSPANSLLNNDYGPQVFAFAQSISTRYLTLAMDGCPQAGDASFNACAIGEVAFRSAGGGGGVVPEPSTWAIMILGFGAAGAMLRRRTTVVA